MPLAEAGWGFFCFLAYAWPKPSFAVVRLGQRIGKLDLQTKLAGRAVGQCSDLRESNSSCDTNMFCAKKLNQPLGKLSKRAASHICVGDPKMLWLSSCLFMGTGLWVN